VSIHTDHRALLVFAFGGFLVLSLTVAVLPALEVEKTAADPGIALQTAASARGRALYLKEGCGFCHTQFVRDLRVDAPYGRGSVAGDYALDDPPLLGTQRTGPDLTNVGQRQPNETWNLIHLYNPRAVVANSVMPGYPWYFEEKRSAAPSDAVVPVADEFKSPELTIVATRDALDLVRYLQSLKQSALAP